MHVKRNIEAGPWNHCCGEAINITYLCMRVHARVDKGMRVRVSVCVGYERGRVLVCVEP